MAKKIIKDLPRDADGNIRKPAMLNTFMLELTRDASGYDFRDWCDRHGITKHDYQELESFFKALGVRFYHDCKNWA